jgi:opacity protein-like surface antigen
MYPLGGSQTSLDLDVGGGVDFQIAHGLAIGGDVRYFHVFSNWSAIDTARVGARFSYRF